MLRMRTLGGAGVIVGVTLASLTLLVLLGRAEVQRRLAGFHLDTALASASTLVGPLERHLNAGHQLAEFGAFDAIATGLTSGEGLSGIAIVGSNGVVGQHLGQDWPATVTPVHSSLQRDGVTVAQTPALYALRVPLTSRFGKDGEMRLLYPKAPITEDLATGDLLVWLAAGLVGAVLSLWAASDVLRRRFDGERARRFRWRFLGGFALVCLVLLGSAAAGYVRAAQRTGGALADGLSHRLASVAQLGVDLSELRDLPGSLAAYCAETPSAARAMVMSGDSVVARSDPDSVRPVGSGFVQRRAIAGTDEALVIEVPRSVVIDAIVSNLQTLLVLLIACGLAALLFLEAGATISSRAATYVTGRVDRQVVRDFRADLSLIKPAYFLLVLINCLSVAFLPQLVTGLAAAKGTSLATASLPFTAYYLAFALIMIPARRAVTGGELRRVMALGCVFEVIGTALIATTHDYWLLTIARTCSGCGQGIFLIGLQSYL